MNNLSDSCYRPSFLSLNFLQANTQCIRNKINELEYISQNLKLDVMCVSEHWLTVDEINIFCPKGFIIADAYCRVVHKNGGSAILIRDSMGFEKVDVGDFCSEIDCEMSCIKLIEHKVLVISLYRSPNGDIEKFFQLFEEALRKVSKNGLRLVVCGDFNIEMTDLSRYPSKEFLNLLRSLNLTCTNKNPTRVNSCLDNILVNFSHTLYEINTVSGCLADHEPLFFKLKILSGNSKIENKTVKTFLRKQSDSNISSFLIDLNKEDWKIFSEYESGHVGLDRLCNGVFGRIVDLWHVSSPIVVKARSINCNTANRKLKVNWYTDSLKQDKNIMMAHFDVYKNLRRMGSEHTQAAYRVYIGYKKTYRRNLDRTKKETYQHYIDESSNKCKAAWDIIKHENTNSSTNEPLLDPETLNSYFLDSVAELGRQFIHTDDRAAVNLMDPAVYKTQNFNWIKISPKEVIQTVAKFSNSKSMDYLWLSNFIIKKIIHSICVPLAFIFNECLDKGFFPDYLKISKVIPVFKKGDKAMPQNYRPVSIVTIFSKIFESLILKQVYTFFESNKLLTDSQFGFRRNKSTVLAVQKVIEEALMAFERGESVSVLMFDLSKAFDCIPFNILIRKLEFYGITGRALQIFKSYLENREQYVSIKGECSSLKKVNTGVPQGSILGPFLFIIAVNDLPFNIPVSSVIYADDTTMFHSDRDLNQLHNQMTTYQNYVLDWFKTNKLVCNEGKTQNLTLSLNNSCEIKVCKLLGFHLDTKLNWNAHIAEVSKKLSRVIYLFWKIKPLVKQEYLRNAYFGFFQSHLQYGIILWGHSTDAHNTLLLQKKIIRILAGKGPKDHCRPLFISLRILTVTNLYILTVLLFTKSNLHDFSLRNNVHHHNTRHNNLLDIPQHRLAKTGKSFKINCIKFFNKLPESAQTVDYSTFKRSVCKWLLDNPFYSVNEFLETPVCVEF